MTGPSARDDCGVSVIIVNWNNANDLAECLGCLRRQSWRDFEIIVVDNGSTDDSVEMVRRQYPEARLIALPDNVGFGAGNNIGFRHAAGRYIALLNNDAFPQPAWLERMCQALENHPEVGFGACKILQYPRTELVDAAGDALSIFGKGLKVGWGQRDEGQYDSPRLVFGACAAAAIYRRAMLEDIGLFDEDFSPANLEDVDLSFRAQLAGYRCLYVPQAVVHHRVSATLKRASVQSFYLHNRNNEYVFWKNMPWPLLLALAPLRAMYVLSALVYHAAAGRGGPFLRAKWDAGRRLPSTWKKRRAIQKRRQVSARYILSMLDKGLWSVRPLGLYSKTIQPGKDQDESVSTTARQH
jgi:GT2 family glycosyltransferase